MLLINVDVSASFSLNCQNTTTSRLLTIIVIYKVEWSNSLPKRRYIKEKVLGGIILIVMQFKVLKGFQTANTGV